MTPATSDGQPLIAARGLRRVFGNGTVALDGLDLDIPAGAFVSLLGPSGCGKSTVLRLLAGLDEPDGGALDWPGGRLARGETGFVFQDPTLLPWASVRDNVYLPLRIAGVERDAAASEIDAAIRLVGLDGFADAKPYQLSGGMRMRVSVARALATKPRLLLMDEPFAALDEMTRFQLNDDLLRIFRQTGCTIVFVTHSVFEAVYLSQRVAVMSPRPGRVLARHDIPLLWPRDAAMRTGPEFGALCRAISADLAAAP
jgi:NitT/TauT family transport system ATP-binding protein